MIALTICLRRLDDGQTFKNRIGITEHIWEEAFFPFVRKECFTLLPVMLKPRSRGYIRLKSKNPFDHPIIDPQYFSHPDDLESMADAMKISFQLATSAPFTKQFGVRPSGRKVPGKTASSTNCDDCESN